MPTQPINLALVSQAAAIAEIIKSEEDLFALITQAQTTGAIQLTANLLLTDGEGLPLPTAGLQSRFLEVLNLGKADLLDGLKARIATNITALRLDLNAKIQAVVDSGDPEADPVVTP